VFFKKYGDTLWYRRTFLIFSPFLHTLKQKGGIAMTLKFWRLVLIYTLAALTALTAYAFAAARQLDRLRLTAGFESARAFEAAVNAAEGLSETLKKISYVSDEALGKSLCAQAYADALSAETALSVLPFDTQEMEKLQGFLGRAGDYIESLCALPEMQLPAEHREHLRAYGEAAAQRVQELFLFSQFEANIRSLFSDLC
jgi:hypothetical protein